MRGCAAGAIATWRWPTALWRASFLDKGDEMTTTVQDIIAGVEVLTTIPEWFSGGGGETKMTVLVGESGAMSIMNALDAAGFVIVSKEALKAGSDGYG